MKKSKLLIPALSVASVGAVVAPMVTSCAKAVATNLITYRPTIKQYEAKQLTAVEAANIYFGASNVADIVKQDINVMLSDSTTLWNYIQLYISLMYEMTWVGSLISAESTFTDVKIEYTDKTKNIGRLSGTLILKAKTTLVDDEAAHPVIIGEYNLETKHVIKNLPYEMVWNKNDSEEREYLKLYLNTNAGGTLNKDKNWTITRSYAGKATYDDKAKKDEEEKVTDEIWNWENVTDETIASHIQLLKWTSYYLENCTKKA